MGVAITDLLKTKEISFEDLRGKKLAIDAYNILYQFLSTIRQRDGALLTDSNGKITSHLVGLFSRTINLMEKGLNLVFVFDGEVPELKTEERERRKSIKQEAQRKYEKAMKEEDIKGMKKYASRTSILTKDMVQEAKELITALGLPIVQAPSEGEAQASYMAKKGDVYAIVSQDADALLFGAPLLIRNLSITGKRKKTDSLTYTTIKPEIIDLAENLNILGIDQDQLIALSILVGTDYNRGGIKGTGPKNALKLVKQYNKDFDSMFKEAKWDEFFDFEWKQVYYLIKKMKTTDDYSLKWEDVDESKIKELLIEKHDFSPERIEKSLSKLLKNQKSKEQKGLKDFF
jgi:flap endonuclease-1